MKLKMYKWGILSFALIVSSACFHNNPAPTPTTTIDDPNSETSTANLPTFTVEVSGNGQITENEGSVGFTVTLSHGMADGINIAYQIRDDTATRQQDFLIFAQDRSATVGSLEIPPNQTTGTFFVFINNDTIDEPNETFEVGIALEGHPETEQREYVTIVDEDPLPEVQLYSEQGPIVRVKESAGFIPLNINLPISQSASDIVIPLVYKTVPGESAVPNVDFVAQDTIVVPPASSQEAENQIFTFNLLIKDDAIAELDESFIVELQDPLDGTATLGGGLAALTIVIEDDDVNGQLNDTQITSCANDTLYDTNCPQIDHPGQDGEYNLPLNLVRLDSSGNITTVDNQTVCIEDQNTGLIWEVKTALGSSTGSKREYNYQYTWFNPLENANGGSPGFEGGINDCAETLERCNTANYVEALNTAFLCNQTNWRIPKLSELVSLMQFGPVGSSNVLVDDSLFLNIQPNFYWTASPTAGFSAQAWAVHLGKTPISSIQNQFVVPRGKELTAHILAVANKTN